MLPNLNLFLRQTKSDLCSFSVSLSIIYNLNVSISFKRKEELTEPKVVNGLIFVLYFWCFSLHCTSGSDVTCQKKLLMLCSPVAAIGTYISPTCSSLQEDLISAFLFLQKLFLISSWKIHTAEVGLRLNFCPSGWYQKGGKDLQISSWRSGK